MQCGGLCAQGSHQHKEVGTITDKKKRYVNNKKYTEDGKTLLDMDLIFENIRMKSFRLIFDIFLNSTCSARDGGDQPHWLCEKREYLSEHFSAKRMMDICRASCKGMPLATKNSICGRHSVCGRWSGDSHPHHPFPEDRTSRNVIILTRNKGYRKHSRRKTRDCLFELAYGKVVVETGRLTRTACKSL